MVNFQVHRRRRNRMEGFTIVETVNLQSLDRAKGRSTYGANTYIYTASPTTCGSVSGADRGSTPQDLGRQGLRKLGIGAGMVGGGNGKANGEGLQIGEGEIDFPKLGKIIKKKCSGVSFIPEIWQGHKNDGEGFWIALDRLKGLI